MGRSRQTATNATMAARNGQLPKGQGRSQKWQKRKNCWGRETGMLWYHQSMWEKDQERLEGEGDNPTGGGDTGKVLLIVSREKDFTTEALLNNELRNLTGFHKFPSLIFP